MNPANLDETPAPSKETAIGPWAVAPSLVFIGFRVNWTPHLADAAAHLALAELWEREFTGWNVGERTVALASVETGYYVKLSDGMADFKCESAAAYEHALVHVGTIIGKLLRDRHERANIKIDSQFVHRVAQPFEALVDMLGAKLIVPIPLSALNAKLFDFNYLADTRINGRNYQLNVGPVRRIELAKRVSARVLRDQPEVAVFLRVTMSKPYRYEFDDIASDVQDAIDVGNTLIRELVS